MSWSISGKAKRASFKADVDGFTGQDNLGVGSKKQCREVKEMAEELVDDVLKGDEFNVSLGGHCQADQPDSAPDSLNIYISAVQ